jgi:hypothetical protein
MPSRNARRRTAKLAHAAAAPMPAPMPAVEPKLAYTIADLIDGGLGSRTKLYEEIKAGRLQVRKQGARTIILPEAVKQYLAGLPESRAA